jgi:hypothetical protein
MRDENGGAEAKMNESSMLKTSAAALAFFLGPLAWAEPWHEVEHAGEAAGFSSQADPGGAPPDAGLSA